VGQTFTGCNTVMKNEHGISFIQIWVSACHFECELYTGEFLELLPFVPRKTPSRRNTPKAPRRANTP